MPARARARRGPAIAFVAGILALAPLAVVLLVARGDEKARPAGSAAPQIGKAAPYVSDYTQVFVVSPDGGRPQAITEAGEEEGAPGGEARETTSDNPVWSPDGKLLAYSHLSCEYCESQLYVTASSGTGEPRLLTRVRNAFKPSWGPGGGKLAVLRPGPRTGIYRVDLASGAQRRLLASAKSIESPAWSPRGGDILFTKQVTATNWEIYSLDARGHAIRRLTSTHAQEANPEWSPAGTRIAFARQTARGTWAIYTMRPDGSGSRRVTRGSVSAVEPTWSPDGRRLAFTGQVGHDSWIAVVAARGGAARRITGGSLFASQPAWSPGGDRIAFTARALETDGHPE
jgi:Tol biopolymer transport system component